MTLKNFLKYVEIQTKVASVIPFLLGTCYAVYRYKNFNPGTFAAMFISLLCFDMTTTAINNYIDYKKSFAKEESSSIGKNIIVKYGISEAKALIIIFTMLGIAVIFGIILTLMTNIITLLVGIISFVVGILYTFGPIPISRMPLGEIFSGFFMGFIIIFLSIFIQIYDKNIILLVYNNGILTININIIEMLSIFLISLPALCGISNIMLANNICDVEEDVKNRRFTLPYYLGIEKSLLLFKSFYYIGFIDLIILVASGIAPYAVLLVLVLFIPVNRAIGEFCKNQIKSKTFRLSVKNFILMNGSQLIIMMLVVIIKTFMDK